MTLSLPPWLHQLGQTLEPWFPTLTLIGLLMAVISTLAIPWLVIRMPADYFTAERRPLTIGTRGIGCCGRCAMLLRWCCWWRVC